MSATSSPTAGYRYVVIEGPIGVGKTGLAQKLAPLMGASLVLEHAEDNPFLERFYRSPRTGALPAQLFFLFQRSRQLQQLRQSDLFSPVERAVLAYTDCLVYDGGRVPDALFATLQQYLTDEMILELTYITALYEMHATMCRALRVEFDDRDEPIVEVIGPEGVSALDVGRSISLPQESAEG